MRGLSYSRYLIGYGSAKMEDSELTADLYSFHLNTLILILLISLNRSDLDAIAFESINLQTEIDLIQRTGTQI